MRYRFGNVELDAERYRLHREGHRVRLEPKTLELLVYLIEQRSRVVSKQELLDALWPDITVGESSLTRCISAARRAIADDDARRRIIENVYGRGYRFAAPVAIRESASDPARAVDIAPDRQRRMPAADAFIGRKRELGELSAALDAAQCGRGQLVLLTGEPGIGKTWTAERFASLAAANGARVAVGRCREGAGAPVYWPWVQILRSEIRGKGPDRLLALMGEGAPELGQLVPELRERLPDLPAPLDGEPRRARFRLFDGVSRFLRSSAREQPLVLALDDLHRADHPSLLLLQFLAPELRDAPMLVVGCYRQADLERTPDRHETVVELARAASARTLDLRGLSPSEVADFVATRAEVELADDAVPALLEQTGGNPYFLEQIVPLLDGTGRLERASGPDGAATPMPRGVREQIVRQLDGLPRRSRELLGVAAVIGREFSLPALALAEGLKAEEVLESLEPCLAAGVIGDPDHSRHYRFAHALLRDALYEGLGSAEQARIHRRVGEALERLYGADAEPHLAELAHHFFEAAATGVEAKALDYALQAGARATRQLAYEEAIDEYQRALELIELGAGGDLQRCDVLLLLGEAHERASQIDAAREALGRAAVLARSIGAHERLARAALGVSTGLSAIQAEITDPFLVNLLEEALAELPPGESPLRAKLLARLALALNWSNQGEREIEIADEALAMAERLGEPACRYYVLSSWISVRWSMESVESRLAVTERLIRHAEEIGSREEGLVPLVLRFATLLQQGGIAQIERELPSFTRTAEELHQAPALWYAVLFRALLALLRGEFEEAERLSHRFLAIGRRVQDDNAVHCFGGFLLVVRWEQGRIGELVTVAQDMVERYPTVLGWRPALALVWSKVDRLEEAAAEVESLIEQGFLERRSRMDWMTGVAFMAEVSAAARDEPSCRRLYEVLLPMADEYFVAGLCICSWGSASRQLGLLAHALGRWDEAEQHFERALRANQRIGARHWLARVHHDYARMLVARGRPGDVARAHALAEAALATARELGFTQLARDLASLE